MFKNLVARYANILHLRFTDTFAALPPHTLNTISRVNFWARVWWVIGYTAGRLIWPLFGPGPKNENLHGKIWLYVVSKNNYESLLFLKEKLPEAVFVAGQHKQIGIYNNKVNRLSTRFKIFYLFKFPVLLWGLFRLKGKRALRFFDLIYTATGYYELSRQAIKKYSPRAIIFANDHNTDARALLLAAKEQGIKTAYIQHASVSASFPPLEFGLNLLEGEDARQKYAQCGPISGEVKLIGMPKADAYVGNKNLGATIKNIGVCTNTIDDLALIKDLLETLTQQFPDIRFSFRPHPSDTRNFNFINHFQREVKFSDARTELGFDFLKQQDALIAADSSIHLEATMLNILCFYFRFTISKELYDYYGYVKTGLVEPAGNVTTLINLIRTYKYNRLQVYNRAKYYNAVLGTEHEGKSHLLALKYLQEYI